MDPWCKSRSSDRHHGISLSRTKKTSLIHQIPSANSPTKKEKILCFDRHIDTSKKRKMQIACLALLFLDIEETFLQRLSEHQRRMRDKRIPRTAIKYWWESPWLYMYQSGDDQALLNMTGVDHHGFNKLLEVFQPYWDSYAMDKNQNIYRRRSKQGRPRHLSPLGGLGLVLTWYRTKGARSSNLALQFGLTSTPLNGWLWFGMICLRSALVTHPKAKICKPTAEEVQVYKGAVNRKYPSLTDVWAAVDGIKLRVSASQTWAEQLKYYNGWQHSHFVNNNFLFSPDGRI